MTRRNPDQSRALSAMRTMLASGWQSEDMLVDHAAEVLGGDEQAKLTAQRAYDQHFKVMGPV
jgi:xanthine/CO dehydrogenase XdhC/CoxF family maturation factor